jgi:hypothetical protein
MLSLEGSYLTIDYTLENTGDKPLITEQYNHNFLAIDRYSVGPDCQLQTSFPIQLDTSMGPLTTDEDTINLTDYPQRFFYARQTNFADKQNVKWSLVHQPSGHGVRVSEYFSLYKFALWGMRHVISPEMFVWIDLRPGDTQTWQRKYTFF